MYCTSPGQQTCNKNEVVFTFFQSSEVRTEEHIDGAEQGMTGNRSLRHSLRPDIGLFRTIRLGIYPGKYRANTCAYLSLMRIGGSFITSLDQQSLFVFDETSSSITSLDQANQPCNTIQALRGYLFLMRPGCSSSRWTNNHYPTS